MRKVFVVACDKSGTQWMARAAHALYPEVYGVHEPLPEQTWLLASGWWEESICPSCATQWFRALHSNTFYDMKHGVHDFDPRGGKNPHRVHYLEASSCLFSLVPIIRSAYPEARIIGILRDGRDVVRSGRNIGWYRNHDWWEPLRLKPRMTDVARELWPMMSYVEQCTWYWTQMVEAFVSEVDVLIQLEDLTDTDGYDHWCTLADAIGFMHPDQDQYNSLKNKPLNVTANKTVGPFAGWPQGEKEDFWRWAAPMMEAAGYAGDRA